MSPVQELRSMVKYFDCLNESFNGAFTHKQLLKIWMFHYSKQGGRVHECADHWPDYLLSAVLKGKVGAELPESVVKRAEAEVS